MDRSMEETTQDQTNGEGKSVSYEIVVDWREHQVEIILDKYSLDCIFNADETGLFWRLQPDRTSQFKGEKCQGGIKSNERLTVLLGASATGEKLHPFVIGKYQNPR